MLAFPNTGPVVAGAAAPAVGRPNDPKTEDMDCAAVDPELDEPNAPVAAPVTGRPNADALAAKPPRGGEGRTITT